MPDGRKNNGGHKTAGRKSKAEEFKLIEQLDKLKDPIWAIKKMFEHIEGGSEKMLEKYLAYRFGMPKQVVSQEVKEIKEDSINLSKFSDDELETYQNLLEKGGSNE